jgi:uncharacterized protein YkwD
MGYPKKGNNLFIFENKITGKGVILKMKNFILAIIIILQQGFLAAQEITSQSYYSVYWRDFYVYPELNKIIDANDPDYGLLDAAIFHATNEIREIHKLPLFTYSPILHQSSDLHSSNMISLDFYGHNNEKNLKFYMLENRIRAFGGNFEFSSENIAQLQIVNTSYYYCPIPKKNGEFQYLNCENNEPYPVYTYLEYAKMAVKNWFESPSHRKNLLSKDLKFLGCAARISKEPYKSKNAPFARLTQNFGGGEKPLLIQVKFEENF